MPPTTVHVRQEAGTHAACRHCHRAETSSVSVDRLSLPPSQHRHRVTCVDLGRDRHVLGEAVRRELAAAGALVQERGQLVRDRSYAAAAARASGERAVAASSQRGQEPAGAPEILDRRAERAVLPPLACRDRNDSQRRVLVPAWRQPRRQPPKRCAARPPAPSHRCRLSCWEIVEPLGDGSTSLDVLRLPDGHRRQAEHRARFGHGRRPAARRAARRTRLPSRRASGTGSTSMPRSAATVTAVVNDSTSTTATRSPATTAAAPTGPQSKPTRNPYCA